MIGSPLEVLTFFFDKKVPIWFRATFAIIGIMGWGAVIFAVYKSVSND